MLDAFTCVIWYNWITQDQSPTGCVMQDIFPFLGRRSCERYAKIRMLHIVLLFIYVIWTILRGSLWVFFSRAYLTLRQIFLGNTSQHRARVYCSFLQNGWHPFFIHYIYGPALAEFYRLQGHSSASKIFPKILIFLVIYGQLMVAWYFHVKWLLTVVKEWHEHIERSPSKVYFDETSKIVPSCQDTFIVSLHRPNDRQFDRHWVVLETVSDLKHMGCAMLCFVWLKICSFYIFFLVTLLAFGQS